MKRFENAQVGDLVYDDVFGDGEIKSIDESKLFSVTARFKKITHTYTNEGHFSVHSIKPTLFYRQGEQRNLTERPEPEKEIDWKEWEDKKIFVRNDETSKWRKRKLYRYQPEFKRKFACYPNNCFNEEPLSFEQAKLIEKLPDSEVDWSKVPSGVKVKVAGNSYGIFMAYLPHLEFPFWVFDEDSVSNAWGYYGCELAEECKPEWIKK